MMSQELRAYPQGPLHLSVSHAAGNHSETLPYIPGTAVRGALATGYLQRDSLKQEVNEKLQGTDWTFEDYFKWLFLSGEVQFPNLYPEGGLVIPLSARSCKRSPGFVDENIRGTRSDNHGVHGVFDTLLCAPPDLRCNYERQAGGRRQPCDAPMEPMAGFYRVKNGKNCEVKPPRFIITRTAIENPTGIVQQGMLYSLEALQEISEGYSGTLQSAAPSASDPRNTAWNILRGHLSSEGGERDGDFNDPKLTCLAVGSNRTRGLGEIRIELHDVSPSVPGLPDLEQRFDLLQQTWQQVANFQVTIFTLTLNSDAIVMDDLWRYISALDHNILSREFTDAPQCHLESGYFTGMRTVSGWNAAHGLPKEDDFAMVKGSAFLYTTSADRDILLPWLQRIEAEGIGERRNEGFGRVIACHPFHNEVRL